MKIKAWLKHAFAVGTDPLPPTEKEMRVIERISIEVVKRRMTTPALTFLEMTRPLNYLGSQTMQFFHPMVSAIADAEDYATFAKFLERRNSIDVFCQVIEKQEAAAVNKEKQQRESQAKPSS